MSVGGYAVVGIVSCAAGWGAGSSVMNALLRILQVHCSVSQMFRKVFCFPFCRRFSGKGDTVFCFECFVVFVRKR